MGGGDLLRDSTRAFELKRDPDWSVFFSAESDWSSLRAAAVAILARAAMVAGAIGDALVSSLRKNRLPDGRPFVSSLKENPPSFIGCFPPPVTASELVLPSAEGSGGELNLTNDRPYFSVCGKT